MSEFLAEARILVRPDTTKFRALLETEVRAATAKPIPIPVVPVAVGAATATAAATQLAAQTTATTGAIARQTAALNVQGAAMAQASARTTGFAHTQEQLQKGLIASTAGLTGLRGAVLSASSPFLIAAVSVTAFAKALQLASNLEQSLNVFRVTAGATADEMERVGEEAKTLGRDLTLPGVTAGDAAQTFLTLSKAGLSVQESLAGARGTLQLAVAAEISFADAAQIAASALNAFALSGDKAIDVADLLTNAANASQASISDMGIALRQSAAIADLAGFSISETVTFLTQLARAGLAGSDAGTSFRVSIQRLIAPTDKAREALRGLHVNLRDATGNLRPEAFFELGDALERMGRAQADAARQTIFGNDASRAAAFFARINAEAFREQEESLTKQGAAAAVAGARNEGFAGKVENLKNQVTALGIELGELSIGPVGFAAEVAAGFFGTLATQIGDTRESFSDLGEDADKLQIAFSEISRDAGLTNFIQDVGEGAGLLAGDLQRASAATDEFFSGLIGGGDAAQEAAPKIRRLSAEDIKLAESMRDASQSIAEQIAQTQKLTEETDKAASAVARLEGQTRGLSEQVTRARIAGDESAELDALRAQRETLEKELAAQEAIIARPGKAGEATAREAIRNRILPQLEAVNNEISNILREQTTENERLAQDAARAVSERDKNLLEALSGRRDDAQRRIAAAAETEGVQDDIRRQNALQALIKIQIQKIRDRISDEKTRKAAIRELRIALIASRAEEDALRAQQKADAAARRAEGISLDIAFAETTENVGREVAARQRLIALLKKQQREVRKGTIEWKRLRNEIAEQQQAIKDAKDQADKTEEDGKTAQQFFFEQLQAQQGFASNLLGNLIPSNMTAGLVGQPAPTTTPGRGVQVAAGVAEARQRAGPTSGQASTTNALLERILAQLKELNGGLENPEATRQRRSQNSVMDYQNTGGGYGF